MNFNIFSSNRQNLSTYLLLDLLNQHQQRQTYFNTELDKYSDALEHFKTEYYREASFEKNQDYLTFLVEYKKYNNHYPSKRELFIACKRFCMLCPYCISDDDYTRCAEFFLSKTGDYIGNIPCDRFYYLQQYYTIEHRMPSSVEEFLSFYRRSIMVLINPSSVLENDVIPRPVEDSKLKLLKDNIFSFKDEKEEENCSICQDSLTKGQNVLKLDCGHFYHTDEKDCCETGSIFKWFENNRVCPVCRKEVL